MRLTPNRHGYSLGLLILTTLVWGTTFPLLKDLVGSLSPAVLIGSRFVIAAVIFLPFCRSLNWRLLRDGGLLGIVAFISFLTQVIGLETISANRAAFITSLNVVIVPLLGWQLGRSITLKILLAAGLAFTGIAIMSWEAGGVGWGEVWMFGCALTYAIYILLMEAFSPRHPVGPFSAVQLFTVGILGGLWAAPTWLTQLDAIQTHWLAIVYLGLVATALATLTQVIAQRHLSASETAIIYTLEPVFAAIFSFWWLAESLSPREAMGSALILVAMLLSQLPIPVFKRIPK
jgi:drug/metabolite transporter (DMT)-like permease